MPRRNPTPDPRDMIHIITFFRPHPPGLSANQRAKYQFPFYELAGDPKEHPELIDGAIRQFERDHSVSDWKQIASTYQVSELNYP